MIGLKITVGEDPPVVVAAEDAEFLTVMLTASGVLGPQASPSWEGEGQECWVRASSSARSDSGGSERTRWMWVDGLGVGDRVVVEIVETDRPGNPAGESSRPPVIRRAISGLLGFEVVVNDAPPITAAADDLYVLTASMHVAGLLGPRSKPARPDQTRDHRLSLAGLTSRPPGQQDEHFRWLGREDLDVGDRVVIRIVDTDRASPPTDRSPAK